MKKLLLSLLLLSVAFLTNAQTCPTGQQVQPLKWSFTNSQCFRDTIYITYAGTKRMAYIDSAGQLISIDFSQLYDSLGINDSLGNINLQQVLDNGKIATYSDTMILNGDVIIDGNLTGVDNLIVDNNAEIMENLYVQGVDGVFTKGLHVTVPNNSDFAAEFTGQAYGVPAEHDNAIPTLEQVMDSISAGGAIFERTGVAFADAGGKLTTDSTRFYYSDTILNSPIFRGKEVLVAPVNGVWPSSDFRISNKGGVPSSAFNNVPAGILKFGFAQVWYNNLTYSNDSLVYYAYDTAIGTLGLELGGEGYTLHGIPRNLPSGTQWNSANSWKMLQLKVRTPSTTSVSNPLTSSLAVSMQRYVPEYVEQANNTPGVWHYSNDTSAPMGVYRRIGVFQNPAWIYEAYSNDGLTQKTAYRKARGTLVSPSSTLSGDTLMDFSIEGYGGSAFRTGGAIQGVAAGNFTSSSAPVKFRIATTPSGSLIPVNRMFWHASGNTSIGADIDSNRLDVTGTARIRGNTRIDSSFITTFNGTAANPSLQIGDNKNGFYKRSSSSMGVTIAGADANYQFVNTQISSTLSGAYLALRMGAPSSSNTMIGPNTDPNTGPVWDNADGATHYNGGVASQLWNSDATVTFPNTPLGSLSDSLLVKDDTTGKTKKIPTSLFLTGYSGNYSDSVISPTVDFVVPIGATMANTNYHVFFTPTDSSFSIYSTPYIVKNKTTTTFTIQINSAPYTGKVEFDWLLVR